MKILFVGDIVGRVGRRMMREKLPYFVEKYKIDFVIANGENATHGKGLIRSQYEELLSYGVDCVTLGNHYNSKNEISRYIGSADRLVRPLNLIETFPGEGSILFDLDGVTLRVTNLLGTAFMPFPVNDPVLALMNLLEEEEPATIHIVDYHAEATAEKQAFAYAFDGKVSAVLGTHTHVQTRDAHVLEKGTAYISDAGMTGFHDGILGCEKESVLRKTIYGQESKFRTPDEGRGVFSAVVIDIDETSGLSKDIFPIYFVEE